MNYYIKHHIMDTCSLVCRPTSYPRVSYNVHSYRMLWKKHIAIYNFMLALLFLNVIVEIFYSYQFKRNNNNNKVIEICYALLEIYVILIYLSKPMSVFWHSVVCQSFHWGDLDTEDCWPLIIARLIWWPRPSGLTHS